MSNYRDKTHQRLCKIIEKREKIRKKMQNLLDIMKTEHVRYLMEKKLYNETKIWYKIYEFVPTEMAHDYFYTIHRIFGHAKPISKKLYKMNERLTILYKLLHNSIFLSNDLINHVFSYLNICKPSIYKTLDKKIFETFDKENWGWKWSYPSCIMGNRVTFHTSALGYPSYVNKFNYSPSPGGSDTFRKFKAIVNKKFECFEPTKQNNQFTKEILNDLNLHN